MFSGRVLQRIRIARETFSGSVTHGRSHEKCFVAEYYMAGTINAKTAAEVCKDVRRQAARMLGLCKRTQTKESLMK